MASTPQNQNETELARRLIETWAQQGCDGFLLGVSEAGVAETASEIRAVEDKSCGVRYRLRWLPHREIRGNVPALEARGILNPHRDESLLFRDPRDPQGRHCFLCEQNIREVHPLEVLVPLRLAGRDYNAGANFAWIEENHFTVMSHTHTDQAYSRHTLEALVDLHRQTGGAFRVLFNGAGAGATIPWHLHYQITTTPMPIEALTVEQIAAYPTLVERFALADEEDATSPTATEAWLNCAHAAIEAWLARDPDFHTLNLLVASPGDTPVIYFFPRDRRHAAATNKGLVGGFEVAGDFVMSAPAERAAFEQASAALARQILEEIRPPAGEAGIRVA